jgi:hypothetical protein
MDNLQPLRNYPAATNEHVSYVDTVTGQWVVGEFEQVDAPVKIEGDAHQSRQHMHLMQQAVPMVMQIPTEQARNEVSAQMTAQMPTAGPFATHTQMPYPREMMPMLQKSQMQPIPPMPLQSQMQTTSQMRQTPQPTSRMQSVPRVQLLPRSLPLPPMPQNLPTPPMPPMPQNLPMPPNLPTTQIPPTPQMSSKPQMSPPLNWQAVLEPPPCDSSSRASHCTSLPSTASSKMRVQSEAVKRSAYDASSTSTTKCREEAQELGFPAGPIQGDDVHLMEEVRRWCRDCRTGGGGHGIRKAGFSDAESRGLRRRFQCAKDKQP